MKETYQKERDMFCLRNLFHVFVSVAVVTSCVVEKLSSSYFSEACINILAKSSANKSRQVFLDIEKAKLQTKYEHLIISASI